MTQRGGRAAACCLAVAALAFVYAVPAIAQSANDPLVVRHEEEVTHLTFAGTNMDIRWTRDHDVTEQNLLIPADVAWAAFPRVFGELGLDPNLIDSKQMIFGNAGAVYRHQIAKERISHYFDCGAMLGVSTADKYDVHIRVISQVVPADGGLSKIRTETEASAIATDRPGGSVRCASNGRFEARIAKMISAEAGKTGK